MVLRVLTVQHGCLVAIGDDLILILSWRTYVTSDPQRLTLTHVPVKFKDTSWLPAAIWSDDDLGVKVVEHLIC